MIRMLMIVMVCLLFNEHLQCAGYCARCLPYAFSLHPQNHSYDSRYIIHSILQMRTLKLREVKLLPEVTQGQRWNLRSDLSDVKTHILKFF